MAFEKDGRKLWLEENIVNANSFLTQLVKAEKKRELTTAEQRLKHVAASYCYLYNIMHDAGLLEEPDEEIFPPETIH